MFSNLRMCPTVYYISTRLSLAAGYPVKREPVVGGRRRQQHEGKQQHLRRCKTPCAEMGAFKIALMSWILRGVAPNRLRLFRRLGGKAIVAMSGPEVDPQVSIHAPNSFSTQAARLRGEVGIFSVRATRAFDLRFHWQARFHTPAECWGHNVFVQKHV